MSCLGKTYRLGSWKRLICQMEISALSFKLRQKIYYKTVRQAVVKKTMCKQLLRHNGNQTTCQISLSRPVRRMPR